MHAVKGKYTKRVDKWKGRVSVNSVAEALGWRWMDTNVYSSVCFRSGATGADTECPQWRVPQWLAQGELLCTACFDTSWIHLALTRAMLCEFLRHLASCAATW